MMRHTCRFSGWKSFIIRADHMGVLARGTRVVLADCWRSGKGHRGVRLSVVLMKRSMLQGRRHCFITTRVWRLEGGKQREWGAWFGYQLCLLGERCLHISDLGGVAHMDWVSGVLDGVIKRSGISSMDV